MGGKGLGDGIDEKCRSVAFRRLAFFGHGSARRLRRGGFPGEEFVGLFLIRLIAVGLFCFLLWCPAWWLAGRIQSDSSPAFRGLLAAGLALAGYISFVNLLGRLTANSILAVLVWLGLSLLATLLLLPRLRGPWSLALLASSWRAWLPVLALAVVLGLPQWLYAVSTNFFDEAASSAIHLTAPSQFAEGVFPPRHNAFPDVPIKYHYGFTMLSGTAAWLTGLSPNVSIDAVSTALWLFIFLFVFFWLRELRLDRFPAVWGSITVLLGGGFFWVFYMPRLEAYSGVYKNPPPSQLLHSYHPQGGWLDNVLGLSQIHSLHLRNGDGSLSHLPWGVASQFQQHPVPIGMALTLVACCLFLVWMKRRDFAPGLFLLCVVCFSSLFLAHAVFAASACVSAGLLLLVFWLRKPGRQGFLRGLSFTVGVTALAFLQGGFLRTGSDYGDFSLLTLRDGFGYAAGGFTGFLHWNLAGFGLPLLLALAAFWARSRKGSEWPGDSKALFSFLAVFGVFSYLVPNLFFYSSETSRIELFTEIAKFFFCAHLAFALLSAFAVQYFRRFLHWAPLVPGLLLMAISPVMQSYRAAFPDGGWSWVGFYRSPYELNGPSYQVEMGRALRRLKKSNRDVYFDASADEQRSGYLSEMLIFGGSVFTLTPSRYERTGVGYRLAEGIVAQRYRLNSRAARLAPGSFEAADCSWFYTRSFEDFANAPLIIRSRFEKALDKGYFVSKHQAGPRELYAVEKPTVDLDREIEKYLRPRIIAQTRSDWNSDGTDDLIFYDYLNKKVLIGDVALDLPEWLAESDFVQLFTASFPGDPGVDFLIARMADTDFRLGESIHDVVEINSYSWSYWDSATRFWQPEYQHWQWDEDRPYIADLDGDGFLSHFSYQPQTGQWFVAPYRTINGPFVPAEQLPMPLAGRFLEGSSGDLGLWSLRTGILTLRSIRGGQTASLKWGGRPGDILVPGDYDGDGYDEVAVWQRSNLTWYWRRAPDGPISQATFGSVSGIPLPADYNHDGRLDLAYWEPAAGFIFVSFDQGRSINMKILTPPRSIPAFVNMF